jgi:hypothetical protein
MKELTQTANAPYVRNAAMGINGQSFNFGSTAPFLLAVFIFLNTVGFLATENGDYCHHGFPFTYAVRFKGGSWDFEPYLLVLDIIIGMAVVAIVWTLSARRSRKRAGVSGVTTHH